MDHKTRAYESKRRRSASFFKFSYKAIDSITDWQQYSQIPYHGKASVEVFYEQ